jgi:hypothetical protein
VSHVGAGKVLDLNAKPQQRLTKWQAFSKLRWDSLKSEFESDWATFKESNANPGHKVAWRRQWLISKLEDLSDDVREAVAEYMKAEVSSEQERLEAEMYQRCVWPYCSCLVNVITSALPAQSICSHAPSLSGVALFKQKQDSMYSYSLVALSQSSMVQ